jgi:hypothetical protein
LRRCRSAATGDPTAAARAVAGRNAPPHAVRSERCTALLGRRGAAPRAAASVTAICAASCRRRCPRHAAAAAQPVASLLDQLRNPHKPAARSARYRVLDWTWSVLAGEHRPGVSRWLHCRQRQGHIQDIRSGTRRSRCATALTSLALPGSCRACSRS